MYIVHYRFSYRPNHLNLCPIRVIRKEIHTTFAIFRYTMLLKIYICYIFFSSMRKPRRFHRLVKVRTYSTYLTEICPFLSIELAVTMSTLPIVDIIDMYAYVLCNWIAAILWL